MSKRIGVLTIGGDCPGSNAVIRGIGKTARGEYGIEVIGFQDGFIGMVQDDVVPLDGNQLSGILTEGGTILGTSREHPQRMKIDGQIVDHTEQIIATYHRHELECLVCLGGGDAQESAFYLSQHGLNVITLPLTIDNDLAGTDVTIGFDSAMSIAAEAIDRLHSTAYSHHRIIIVEVMGRETGWLTLSAGIAGGADVILIPEIPYDEQKIANAILSRRQAGKRFSIIAVSEGALSEDYRRFFDHARQVNERLRSGEDQTRVAERLSKIENRASGNTIHLANQLEKFTGLEARITILGYLQRGGTPTAADRVLATQLSTACVDWIQQGKFGVMVAVQGHAVVPLELSEVAARLKTVPIDHPWIISARRVGTNLGDE